VDLTGVKEALGFARATPKPAETAGEQRAPRGVTADGAGKALKTETLRAEVARNKATRPRQAKTAERVRNPEGGRRRGGKPA
jgi:hypothetical protein